MKIGTFCHEMGHMLFNWPDLYYAPPKKMEGSARIALWPTSRMNLIPFRPTKPSGLTKVGLDVQDLAADKPRYFHGA